MSDTKRSCEFCDKRGLPVMPVRYALAEKVGRVPPLASPMTADNVAAIPDSSKAQYTARLLRSGYLYTYDEARKRWDGYFVNDGGYYLRFDIKQPMSPALAKARQPCTDEGHQEIASCVTIRDPKNATKVWFGFSDVEWTQAVLKRHEDADYRKRHMRLLDVKAWLSSKQHPHAQPIEAIQETVAEYTRLMLPHKSVFGWSPFKFHNRQSRSDNLIKTAQQLAPNGLILGIPDPAGIAQELASMMVHRVHQFITAPERTRQLANVSAINMLERGVKMQVELQESANIDYVARNIESGGRESPDFASWSTPNDDDVALANRFRDKSWKESTDKKANATWAEYKKYYNDDARKNWEKKHNEEAKAFGDSAIEPLAKAHVAWMQSARMSNYFDCNYDPADWDAGLVYTQVVTACVENTQDKQVCHDLYSGWLDKSQTPDHKNILAKALKFNHKSIEDAIQAVPEQSLDFRALPWDSVIDTYNAAVTRLGESGGQMMARLVTQIAGPAAKIMSKALDGIGGTAFVAIMGGISGTKMVKVTFTGKRSEFRRVIVRELLKGTGQLMTPKELDRAVLAEMNRLRMRNGKLPDGKLNRTWFVMIDPKALAKVLAKAGTAEEAAGALRTMQQFEDMAQHNWNTAMNSSVRIGIVTGVVQVVCLTKLMEDDAKAMGHEKGEASWRLGLSAMAVVGTFAEAAGTAMEKVGAERIVSQRGRGLLTWGSGLKLAGRAVGAIAGGVLAGLDFMKAGEEKERGNYGVMLLYVGSGLLGLAIAVGVFFLGPLIMLLLVLALIFVTIGIEFNKPNKLMEWLQRSHWGKGPGNNGSVEKDTAELKLALKG